MSSNVGHTRSNTSAPGTAPCDWQTERKALCERSKYLLECGMYSDCQFLVGVEPNQRLFKAHKLFLVMGSPVFEAMFFGGMAPENSATPIIIPDVQPEAFKALLEYLYSDNINLQSFDQACEICYAAKKYMIPHLVETCTKFMWQDLYPRNACRAYEFAKLFEEPVMMERCLQIIKQDAVQVLRDASFEDLEENTLITVLSQDELDVPNELELFEALQRWGAKECQRKGTSVLPDNVRQVISGPLKHIRFLALTPGEFASGPAVSGLLQQEESFAILMNLSSPGKWPIPETINANLTPRKGPFYPQPNSSGANASTSSLSSQNLVNRRTGLSRLGDRSGLGDRFFSSDAPYSVGHRISCRRALVPGPASYNTSILDCSVTFMVDRNICVHGIEIPSQVYSNSLHNSDDVIVTSDQGYNELLYAHLLDSDGSRLTYTHFTSRINYDSTLEITFNRPVYVQRGKMYRIGVVLNKEGWYPSGTCSTNVLCEGVQFSFCIGNAFETVRDGLIRSVIFNL